MKRSEKRSRCSHRGDFDKLTHVKVNYAVKLVDRFVSRENDILYYLGLRHESRELLDEDLKLRLVAPTTLIDEILLNCHDSVEGIHQGIVRTFHLVKSDFYWIGLYADVTKHI